MGNDKSIPKITINQISQTQDRLFEPSLAPIYLNSELVGSTTSGVFEYTLGKPVMLGYVRNPEGDFKRMVKESGFVIEVACERYPVVVSLRAFYDPMSRRMKV